MTEQEIYNLIKQGYDPIPSMYPKTLFALQNGKSMTDFINFMDLHFWQLYIYSRMLRKMSETSMSTKTVNETYKYLADKPAIHPIRSKDWDGFRAKTIVLDEWNEYCRRDVEVTKDLNKRFEDMPLKFNCDFKNTIGKVVKVEHHDKGVKIYFRINKKVKESMRKIPFIKNVIFNEPATIVFWTDDTKTVVKCQNEKFDPEKGLAMAIAKKALGNVHDYYGKNFGKWISEAAVKVEEKPKEELKPESPTLQIGDKAVVIGNACPTHYYKDGDIVRIVNRGISNHTMFTAIESRTDKGHPTQYIDKENLKKLASDQTMRPGDKLVVIKWPSYGCHYEIGDVIKVDRIVEPCVTGGNIIQCYRLRDGMYQRLNDTEVVKIVDDTPKVEPEKPKRMTFREEVAIKEPNRICGTAYGGVMGCPRDRDVLCKECYLPYCWTRVQKDACCCKCWDREIPEEKPVEDSVLRAGDKAVKVKTDKSHVDYHKIGSMVEVTEEMDADRVITKFNRFPGDTQIVYRRTLRKLSKDQTMRPGDLVVVTEEPSFCCGYAIGDIVRVERSYKGDGNYNVIECVSLDGTWHQGFKSTEAVKIVK